MQETKTVCPNCETSNQHGSAECAECGTPLLVATEMLASERPKRPFPLANVIAGVVALLLFGLAFQNWRNPDALALAFRPTATPSATAVPTTPTRVTPTHTPLPTATNTATPAPSAEPTDAPTPFPTATLRPPYTHTISTGEVLINVALRYNVSIDSIIAANDGLSPQNLGVGEEILVPRPTATPPLVPVDIEINGEPAVADPLDCVQHEITQNETLFGIAVRYNVTIDALLLMNRIDQNALLSIGDTVCIPTIIFNVKAITTEIDLLNRSADNIRQPTLLYPSAEATLTTTPVTLQWIAERDLAADEQYMVELTYLDDADARPIRAFTGQTSWQLPQAQANAGMYRWRVSFVSIRSSDAANAAVIAPVYDWNGPVSERTFTLELELE